MKILFLTPQLPYPPHQGTTIRNLNILRGLATRHEIDLLAFGRRDELQGTPLAQYCRRIELVDAPARSPLRRIAETFASPLPDMARRLHSPDMSQAFLSMTSESRYDAIQIEGIEMAPYWLSSGLALRFGGSGQHSSPFVLFDDHNAEYVLQKTAFEADSRRIDRLPAALYSLIQWHKLSRFERDLCLRADCVAAVSQHDANALHALDSRIRPAVIPNGVDLDYYSPATESSTREPARPALVFTGKMDFRPNIDAALWFAREILPLIRREIPGAHFSLVGQKPAPTVQALAERPGVEVTGAVPDTRPYIGRAAVYLVPLRMGGGTRLKVLEAMAMGKAIVSTSMGAEGIEYRPDRDLLIADDPGIFASAVVALLRNPERRRALGWNARRLAAEKYDWNAIVPLFDKLLAGQRGSPAR
ncbi:MAG: glycosyltransferase [Rudaea sp.]